MGGGWGWVGGCSPGLSRLGVLREVRGCVEVGGRTKGGRGAKALGEARVFGSRDVASLGWGGGVGGWGGGDKHRGGATTPVAKPEPENRPSPLAHKTLKSMIFVERAGQGVINPSLHPQNQSSRCAPLCALVT